MPTGTLAHQPAATGRIWGLDAIEIHDAYWASFGVSCVRLGSGTMPDPDADVFLLLDEGQLAVFDLRTIADTLLWNSAECTRVHLLQPVKDGYRERILFGADGNVAKIERKYNADRNVSGQVYIARRRAHAEAWAMAATAQRALAAMRVRGRVRIDAIDCAGRGFHSASQQDREQLVRAIATAWAHPDRVIEGIRPLADGVFGLASDRIAERDRCIGPLWIGERPRISRGADAPLQEIGPSVVWDRATTSALRVRPIGEIFSHESGRESQETAPRGNWYRPFKRAFDVVFAASVLVVFSPLILAIAIAVVIDDGFPIFFGHRRQTKGGGIFRCWKFRTMRRNAEALVAELRKQNLCDGPQVFIRDDPRVTRVGKILRRFQLDEFPQFWNVLKGEMSVVGPRPSPDNENQFCPAWREKRLSVRPGITGLWQVMRTRAPGKDFQEWIQYDIEYVERKGPLLDLRIIVMTVMGMLRIGRKSADSAGTAQETRGSK